MTALIVIGAVALVLFILLASSLTVDFEYDESFSFKVKYLFFTIIMNPNSPRRIKKKEKKEAKKKKKEEKKREKEKKQALKKNQAAPPKEQSPKPVETKEKVEAAPSEKGGESSEKRDKKQEQKKDKQEKEKKKDKHKKKKLNLDLILSIIKKASPHVKRIFKKIRFYNIVVDITVGGDDAAKVAISYGAHCSAVYSIVAFLQNTVTFKAKKIDVKGNFNLEKSRYYARGTVKLRLSTLLHSAIWGACAVLLEIVKANKSQPNKEVSSKKAKPIKAA